MSTTMNTSKKSVGTDMEDENDDSSYHPDDDNVPLYKFRRDWGACPPKDDNAATLRLPLDRIVFTYTGGEECHSEIECTRVMRKIQDDDMNRRGLSDLQYNFYIGNDNYVYEGLGFTNNAPKDFGNDHLHMRSFDIAFIGDYTDKDPDKTALHTCRLLLNFMVNGKVLTPDYIATTLLTSRQNKAIFQEHMNRMREKLEK